MIEIKISPELKAQCQPLCLGCIQAKVKVEASPKELLAIIDQKNKEILNTMNIEQIAELDQLVASRETYKRLGKNPGRYRNSAEALMRRVLQGKGIYIINNVVEINNLISLKAACSVGSYDLANIKGGIRFTVGKEGEQYKGIGKELINVENLPILEDDLGKFGSPTSDSERAMINFGTKEVLMMMFSFGGPAGILDYLTEAKELLTQYAAAKDIEIAIIE